MKKLTCIICAALCLNCFSVSGQGVAKWVGRASNITRLLESTAYVQKTRVGTLMHPQYFVLPQSVLHIRQNPLSSTISGIRQEWDQKTEFRSLFNTDDVISEELRLTLWQSELLHLPQSGLLHLPQSVFRPREFQISLAPAKSFRGLTYLPQSELLHMPQSAFRFKEYPLFQTPAKSFSAERTLRLPETNLMEPTFRIFPKAEAPLTKGLTKPVTTFGPHPHSGTTPIGLTTAEGKISTAAPSEAGATEIKRIVVDENTQIDELLNEVEQYLTEGTEAPFKTIRIEMTSEKTARAIIDNTFSGSKDVRLTDFDPAHIVYETAGEDVIIRIPVKAKNLQTMETTFSNETKNCSQEQAGSAFRKFLKKANSKRKSHKLHKTLKKEGVMEEGINETRGFKLSRIHRLRSLQILLPERQEKNIA